jgi:hypothetical protein
LDGWKRLHPADYTRLIYYAMRTPVLQSGVQGNLFTMTDSRPSPIAGTWYPGDPEILQDSIDRQLDAVEVDHIPGTLMGIVAPHAGHRYSGQIAAKAFRCLTGLEPDVVAVVSPLHHPHHGKLFTTAHKSYRTPFGEIPVDHALLEQLETHLEKKSDLVRIRRDQEHSIEIELPFLQRVLHHPFQLLPLMLLDQTQPLTEQVGHALGKVLEDKNAILVASSDLSHFYPSTIAQKLDTNMLNLMEAFDPSGILTAEEERRGFACGRGAIAAVLWAAKDLGADQCKVLAYAHSGDVTGDQQAVVGYGAAAIYRAH